MNNRRQTINPRIISFAVIFLAAVLLSGCPGGGASQSPQEKGSDRQAKAVSDTHALSWRDDLEVFARELPERHKNLFFQMDEQEYFRRLNEIKGDLSRMSDDQVELELRRLLTKVGDAHTNLSLDVEKILPLRFTHFKEGLFLTRAGKRYTQYLGMELITIDGHRPREVKSKIGALIPHDNESQLWHMYPVYLILPRYLQALGIDKGDGMQLEFRDAKGQTHTVEVEAVPLKRASSLQSYLGYTRPYPQDEEEVPLYLRDPDSIYHTEYCEAEDLLYIQYNRCATDPEYPFFRLLGKVESRLDAPSCRKVVVDLRWNSGGDSRVLQPLINIFSRDYAAGREYELFVIIGRSTFSSAVLNAIKLRQDAGALFVGEPSGGRPNHYGEVKRIKLPYSGLSLSYSTKYFTMYEKDVEALQPDIRVLPSFSNYSAWKDGALEAVRRYPEK